MKTIHSFLAVALIAIVAVGCGKVEKILPKKDGTWTTTKQVEREYENDVLQSTDDTISVSEFTFQDDGSGTYVEGGASYAFTWSVNDDNDEISVCESFSGVSFCFTYDIVESSKDAQKWYGEIVDDNFRTELELELARKD